MTAGAHPQSSMTPAFDIIVESALWAAQPQAAATVRRALMQAALAMSTIDAELAIVLTDDSGIRSLNRIWRGIDRPTNVLSFPTKLPHGADAARSVLGDIVVGYETTAQEAIAERKPFNHHLAHLAVHGFLHLLGYDHEQDDDAETMERLERSILARLDVPDPYLSRDASG